MGSKMDEVGFGMRAENWLLKNRVFCCMMIAGVSGMG
jgi:hypothetical protein